MNLQEMLDTNDGVLSPEDATALLDRAMNGETIDFDELAQDTSDTKPAMESSEPPATTESKDSQATDEQLNADNAVIMAKDGKHTIPFEKLQQAREAERLALQQAQQANAELEKLRAQLAQGNTAAQQAKVDNQIDIAQKAIDNGVDPSIFGDFDEEGLANGIQTLVQQQVEARIKQALEPIAQKQQIDETQQHYAAILQAHPDIASVAESREFESWVNGQPSYAQQAINGVLQQGTTQQVIELFDQFKAANTTAAPTTANIKQAAKAKLDSAQPNIPASLSDIAGGQAHTSPDEQLANLSGADMLAAMEKMSPEQIERILNKTL